MFKIRMRSLCFLGSDLIFGSEEGEGEERGVGGEGREGKRWGGGQVSYIAGKNIRRQL
jgi:hypothetical protein